MTCILYLSSCLDVRIDQTKQTQCCSDEANTVLPRRSKHSVTHLFSFLCYVFSFVFLRSVSYAYCRLCLWFIHSWLSLMCIIHG